VCLWVYSRGRTGPGGSGPDGLDGRIPAAVQGDEGMSLGRKLPFFSEGKRSEPLQTADCSRWSHTAAGSGRINRTQLCRLPLTPTLLSVGMLVS